MNKVNPLVSCIIPTKDRPDFVLEAVKSVRNQTYKNIEIIVIDDSTNNFTHEVLSRTALGIRYIKNEKNRGAPYSRNIGLCEAKGDVISFLDDDDVWLPHKIETQLAMLNICSLIGCCYIRMIDGEKHYIKLPSLVSFEEMLYFNYLGSCSFAMVSRETVANCFFDETLESGQDWDMWINIMKKNVLSRMAISQEYLALYNVGTHIRISDSDKAMKRNITILHKYEKDHNAHSTKMFLLYNILPSDNSFSVAIAKEFLKSKLKNKNLLFLISLFLNKLFFRRTIVY